MMIRVNENNQRALEMLRYQVNNYKAVGNGAMTQQLNAKIRRLMEQSNAVKSN
ncbi:hypothetical protein LJC38_06595 [Parabacteroides sp. OttesenSCG-928-K15]|nr:hypothetical protein [Parabacteroides sp. OttesenSCG-928-K15]